MSMRSGGSELTNSVSRRAGTVVVPSSSTLAPIQVVMAMVRSVAASRSRDSSAASRMLLSTGSVLRLETARATVARPFCRFSCKHETFTFSLHSAVCGYCNVSHGALQVICITSQMLTQSCVSALPGRTQDLARKVRKV